MVRWGVVVFPGSNCDHDCYHVLKHVLGQEVCYLWHKDEDLRGVDCIVLPGGFSYGDYLRVGAIARFGRLMARITEFAQAGGLVLGSCNGFQILVEAGLLPGAFLRNASLKFVCRDVYVRVENVRTPFTCMTTEGEVLRIPIAHGAGNYYLDPPSLARMEERGQVVLRYCSADGKLVPEANPNGSVGYIAGVCNERRNVMGMMPHPERCSEGVLGNESGRLIFASVIRHLAGREAALAGS